MAGHPLILHLPDPLATDELRPGQATMLGLYEIQQAVGEDRQAKLYRGWDVLQDIPVSLRLLNAGLVESETALAELASKIARIHQHAHPAFVLPYHLVRLPDRTLIIEEWLHETKLLTLLRGRGSLPLAEALPILAPLAAAVDFAIEQSFHPFDLTLRHVMLAFPEPSAFTEGQAATEVSVHQWPSYEVKVSPLALASTRVKEPLNQAFGKLFYQTLGGHVLRYGSNAYVPLTQLTESGNARMRAFLTDTQPAAACLEVLRQVCLAESLNWDPALASAANSLEGQLAVRQLAQSLPAQVLTKQEQVTSLLEQRRQLQEEEARRLQEEEARRLQEEEARRLQEEEARRLQEEEARRLQEEEARRLQEEEARRLQEEEARRLQEEEARRLQEEEARRLQEEETRLLHEEREAAARQEERRQADHAEDLHHQEAEVEGLTLQSNLPNHAREGEDVQAGETLALSGQEKTPAPLDPPSDASPSVSPSLSRPRLLAGASAALILAAAGTFLFFRLIDPQPAGPPATPSASSLQENLQTLTERQDWPALYAQLTAIPAHPLSSQEKDALLEQARAALPPLFASISSWPSPDSLAQLDSGSQEMVRQLLIQFAQEIDTPTLDAAAGRQLFTFADLAFPKNALPPEIDRLAQATLTAFNQQVQGGEPLDNDQSAALDVLTRRSIAGASLLQSEAATLAAAREREAALAAALEEAREWVAAEKWDLLFARLDDYAALLEQPQGELWDLASPSVPALYQSLETAPPASTLTNRGPLTRQLVGRALANLANDVQEAAPLAALFIYARDMGASPLPAPLAELGTRLAGQLASAASQSLTKDQRLLLEALAACALPDAQQLLAGVEEKERTLLQRQEAWEDVRTSMEEARQQSQWPLLLALLDDPRLTAGLREQHHAFLDDCGQTAAGNLLQDSTRLPDATQWQSWGPTGKKHLAVAVAAAAQEAADARDVSRLAAYLRWYQDRGGETPPALASAADTLAATLAQDKPDPDLEAQLRLLESLGSSVAAETLGRWEEDRRRLALFQNAHQEATALASQSDWQKLFDQLDSYLANNFTEEQQEELLAIARPAVAVAFQNLDTLPPATAASGYAPAKAALVRDIVQQRAAESLGDLTAFRRWLAYQGSAFPGNLSPAWLSLGAQAVNVIKRDQPETHRPFLQELAAHGVAEAASLLAELDQARQLQAWTQERAAIMALARRQPGEALSRFLAAKETFFNNDTTAWKAACQADIDGILANLTNAQGVEAQLAALARDRFARAQQLLDQLKAATARNTEPQSPEDFRRLFPEKQKDRQFVADYMKAVKKAVDGRSPGAAQEMEQLALHALDLGMVDAGFSSLDSLYTEGRVRRPSALAQKQIPNEFGGFLSNNKAARKGWQGIWMMRGHPPFDSMNVAERQRQGLQLLQEAAPEHEHSRHNLENLKRVR